MWRALRDDKNNLEVHSHLFLRVQSTFGNIFYCNSKKWKLSKNSLIAYQNYYCTHVFSKQNEFLCNIFYITMTYSSKKREIRTIFKSATAKKIFRQINPRPRPRIIHPTIDNRPFTRHEIPRLIPLTSPWIHQRGRPKRHKTGGKKGGGGNGCSPFPVARIHSPEFRLRELRKWEGRGSGKSRGCLMRKFERRRRKRKRGRKRWRSRDLRAILTSVDWPPYPKGNHFICNPFRWKWDLTGWFAISKLSSSPILVNETQKKMPGTIISDPVMFIARVCSNYIYTGGYVIALARLNLAPHSASSHSFYGTRIIVKWHDYPVEISIEFLSDELIIQIPSERISFYINLDVC